MKREIEKIMIGVLISGVEFTNELMNSKLSSEEVQKICGEMESILKRHGEEVFLIALGKLIGDLFFSQLNPEDWHLLFFSPHPPAFPVGCF